MEARHLALVTLVVVLEITVGTCDGDQKQKRHNPAVLSREYCESEAFTAKCWQNEIVVMESAFYGRMRIGHCVEADLGYLGCSEDVLHLLDGRCSGKQDCEIRIPDGELDETKPCYKELKVYLETSYTCVRATKVKDYLCKTGNAVVVDTNPHYLSKQADDNSNCRPGKRPLVLEAQPGQQINLTLIDFSWKSHSRRSLGNGDANCIHYGYIYEKGAQQNITICGNSEREKHVYESKSHRVEVVADWDSSYHFIVKYEASGCADLREPKDAWLNRDGDSVVVGCDETRQTWHLKCRNNKWSGVIGNCTQHLVAAKKTAQLQQKDIPMSHSVAIVIIVGVALVICFVIVGIGMAFLKRYRMKCCAREKAQIRYNNVRTEEENQKAASLKGKGQQQTYQSRNQYFHRPIWQSPLPQPGNNNAHALECPRDVSGGPGYGGSVRSEDRNYNKSMKSATDSESQRYFILDREAVIGAGQDPKDPGGIDRVV